MPSGPPPGVLLLLLATLAQVLAAVGAVLVARKRAPHVPVAKFLVLVSVANLVAVGLILNGAPTTLPPVPYFGMARVIHHVRQALYFTWSFGFIWMSVKVFLDKAIGWYVAALYLVVMLVFIFGYPAIGGEHLQRAYLVVELAGLLIGSGMFIQFIWKRESVTISHLVIILLLFSEFAVLVGAWTKDIFTSWDLARVMYLVAYLTLAVIQGGYVWFKRIN